MILSNPHGLAQTLLFGVCDLAQRDARISSGSHRELADSKTQESAPAGGQLLTPESLKTWMDWRANPNRKTYWLKENHDTIGMIAADGKGYIVAGCSTSGMAFKIPGRVADSSLVGCGVYADDNAGAASATGDGDLMTNYCTSVSIVRSMERGASPQEACEDILRLMSKTDPRNKDSQSAVIAMNPKGEMGNASMNSGFRLRYAVYRNGAHEIKDGMMVF